MTADKPQSTEPEGGHVAPDPLAMSVASTAEEYTAAKLTPDPGSDIGKAIPVVAAVVELPDTAEKEHPPAFQQLELPQPEPEQPETPESPEVQSEQPESVEPWGKR